MEHINLLQFLNMSKKLYLPTYVKYDFNLINLLSMLNDDNQFVKSLDLGIVYYNRKTLENFTIVDGFNKFLSLSLLLHAICECYKKTSQKNDNAIKVIRSKYLLNGEQTKLRLDKKGQAIYDKIIFGERLSGKEKESPLFRLLHELWTEIKTKELQAANIFNTLSKITFYIVDTENAEVDQRYIGHEEVQLILKDESFNYIWLHEKYLITGQSNLSADEIIKILEKITLKQ